MALEINLVNLGTYPNDGSGDDLRTAFEKSNANFASLEENVVLSAVNLGNGAPFYSDKLGNDLRFRSIKSLNSKLSISYDSNEISLAIATFLERIEEDTAPKLGGNLDLNNFEINGIGNIDIAGVIIADGFEGVLVGNVYGDLFGSVFGNLTGNVTGQVSDLSNHNLESLGNVSTETPVINESLVWNGTFWSPTPVVTKIVAGDNITISPVDGTGEITINANTTSAPSTLEELTDVVVSNPTEGQVLKYNGTNWVNSNNDSLNLSTYDFGLLSGVRDPFDLLFQFTSVNFGTFTLPSSVNFDLGIIGTTPPTTVYQLASSSLTVQEGGTVTITLTTNATDGTVVPYQITGVTSDDINGTSLTGSFLVNSGTASVTIPITIDALTETETLTLSLLGISPVVAVSISIEDFILPLVVDGGAVIQAGFESALDGGTPITASFALDIDGGVVEGLGIIPALIDGGAPITVHTVVLDGETPTTPITVIADGEAIL